jgi:hypothetical protein
MNDKQAQQIFDKALVKTNPALEKFADMEGVSPERKAIIREARRDKITIDGNTAHSDGQRIA